MSPYLFSIGHGNKPLEQLLEELRSFDVAYLIDVRSRPYSKHNPQYRKSALEKTLSEAGITYVFLGDQLGGMPEDRNCYTNGRADYQKIRQQTFFQQGLSRLLTAYEKGISIAVMCSESDPGRCHRTHLIGQALAEQGISIQHITGTGKIKMHNQVVRETNKGQHQITFPEKK